MRLILARVLFNFDMRFADEKEWETEDWMDQKIWVLWIKKPLNVVLTPVEKPGKI
jgi:hypothetical protein